MIIKFENYNKQILAIVFLLFVFLINLSIEYTKYLDFIDEEIYETKVEVLNMVRFVEMKGKYGWSDDS